MYVNSATIHEVSSFVNKKKEQIMEETATAAVKAGIADNKIEARSYKSTSCARCESVIMLEFQ